MSRKAVRSRQIVDTDLEGIVDLLARGFPQRAPEYWMNAIRRLAEHPLADGAPRYGYVMECGERFVGVILLISTDLQTEGGHQRRCNVSSWYVDPEFRGYAGLLAAQVFKRAGVTYQNISSEAHTRATIEAQGFSPYTTGLFLACVLPLALRRPRCTVDDPASPRGCHAPADRQLLEDHARYGCVGFWCSADGRSYPFVFARRVVKGLPCAQLIYCRDIEDMVRFAPAISRRLARAGCLFIIADARGPLRGLWGRFFAGAGLKYFKGPVTPRIGDLAYTEAAMFGM
jgi:hypothetical protein